MTQSYRNPANNQPSSVGPQIVLDTYKRKALIEAMKEQYFLPLADVTTMPKNAGKRIKQYVWVPLLDDRNMNDEGIDANGAIIDATKKSVHFDALQITFPTAPLATAAATAINAVQAGFAVASVAAAPYTVTLADTVLLNAAPANATSIVTAVGGNTRVTAQAGNLYGSSRDIGVVSNRMPALAEDGGRVNRVGFTRLEIEGTMHNYGIFEEYTQDSVDFDTEAELTQHKYREITRAASQLTEDMLQIDLLNNAGTVRYAGTATSTSTIAAGDKVTYGDLVRLGISLDKLRSPKKTTIITGSRMIDTKVIPACRIAFCSPDLLPTLMATTDMHTERAWIPVEKYQAGGYVFNSEEGSVAGFRFVTNNEMMRHVGGGATTADTTVFTSNGRVDVFPILTVGPESFTTIGFQSGNATGGSGKFDIKHQAPGMATMSGDDPYGKLGRTSIQWWYGFMGLRTQRIAVYWTAASL